jgi:drug/metabolite transporter (DMT)-like permease
MTQPDPLRRRAILALVMVNLLWGISFPAMKATNMILEGSAGTVGLGESAPEVEKPSPGNSAANALATRAMAQVTAACFLIVVRFSIALVLLGVYFPRLFVGLTLDQWRMGAWTGLAFAAGFVLQIVGLNYVPASRSGFLTSLSVVFTPLAMLAIERSLPRWSVVVGAAAALFGTAVLTGVFEVGGPVGLRVVAGATGKIGLGDWLTALAATVFTVQILLIDRYSRRMPAGKLTPGMFVATLAIGGIVFIGGHIIQPPADRLATWADLLISWRFMLLVLLMSVFCTVLAFYWMNKYQGHVTPAQAALIYTLEPIFATLWAMLLPDYFSTLLGLDYPSERPGLELVAGGLFVVFGNALALWPAKKANEATGEGLCQK